MSTEIVGSQKPEEKELIKKLAELEELEEKLTQRELELTTLSAEMRTFEAVYLRRVGVRYSKLDEIEARIAEAQARLNPQDGRTAERVTQARRRAQESAKATSYIPDTPQKDKLEPSDSLKMLYREAAKKSTPTFVVMRMNGYADRK